MDLFGTLGADEVMIQQIRVNAIFAVSRPTAGCLDTFFEELVVDWTGHRGIWRWLLANVSGGEAFRSLNLLLPRGTVQEDV